MQFVNANRELVQTNTPELTEDQINYIQKKLIECLIKDSLPFNILKSPNFQSFISSLNPRFQIPNINSIKESIAFLYDNSANEIQSKLTNDCHFASITTDFWTASHQKKGYMGITCSWISEKFEPIEILLNRHSNKKYIRNRNTKMGFR